MNIVHIQGGGGSQVKFCRFNTKNICPDVSELVSKEIEKGFTISLRRLWNLGTFGFFLLVVMSCKNYSVLAFLMTSIKENLASFR